MSNTFSTSKNTTFYELLVSIKVGNDEFKNIPCKIYASNNYSERPFAVMNLLEVNSFSIAEHLEGEYSFDQFQTYKIKAKTIVRVNSDSLLPQISDFKHPVTFELYELEIINLIEQKIKHDYQSYIFMISNNTHLSPIVISNTNNDGSVSIKKSKLKEFVLTDKFRMIFDSKFKFINCNNGNLLRKSYLVALSDVDLKASNLETIKNTLLQSLDEILLLSSFFSRQRTICYGLEVTSKYLQLKYYRGNITKPDTENSLMAYSGIIHNQDFEGFVQEAYTQLQTSDSKQNIISALHATLPTEYPSIESRFLYLFSSFEALVTSTKSNLNLSRSKFRPLKKILTNEIDKFFPEQDNQKKIHIKNKILELNKISFNDALTQFIQENSILINDLWPITQNETTPVDYPLSKIRNKLAHGESLPIEAIQPLTLAIEHLEKILQRTLVILLKCDLELTSLTRVNINIRNPEFYSFNEAEKKLTCIWK